MGTKDKSSPAFPRPATLYPSNAIASSGQPGTTLHDYFMAHAPEQPQNWFAPEMPPRPDANTWVSDDGQRMYSSPLLAQRAEGDCFTQDNQKEVDQWDAKYLKQKFVQWPAAWADEQIKARLQ